MLYIIGYIYAIVYVKWKATLSYLPLARDFY